MYVISFTGNPDLPFCHLLLGNFRPTILSSPSGELPAYHSVISFWETSGLPFCHLLLGNFRPTILSFPSGKLPACHSVISFRGTSGLPFCHLLPGNFRPTILSSPSGELPAYHSVTSYCGAPYLRCDLPVLDTEYVQISQICTDIISQDRHSWRCVVGETKPTK